MLASTPASTKMPKALPVSSKDIPKVFAVSPTVDIAVLYFSRSNEDEPNNTAMLSATRPVSLASIPN